MAIWLGVLVGLALGLTGGGGSILAVPMLIYGLGMDAKVAVSMSLAAVAFITAAGTISAGREGMVEVRVALFFAVTGMLAAPFGVAAGQRVSEAVIVVGFALLMLLVGLRMFWRARRQPAEASAVRAGSMSADDLTDDGPVCRYSADGVLRLNAPCSAALAAMGAVVGFLSGFFGVGGGFLIVPALLLITQMGIHRAVATSLLVITLIGLSGVAASYLAGREVPWGTTGIFVLGGLAGMGLGRRLASRLAGPTLQQLFAMAILAIGTMMIAVHWLGVPLPA